VDHQQEFLVPDFGKQGITKRVRIMNQAHQSQVFFLKAIQFTPIQGEEGVLTTEPQVRNSEAYLQTLVVCFNSRK